jgi:hypothetical protein
MVQTVYNKALFDLLNADLDFNLPDDIRVLLLEAATDVNPDDTTVSAVLGRAGTTELTSTGYTRTDGTLTGEGTTQDDTNDRAEFDATDATFSTVSQAASEVVDSYLIFRWVTTDADSIPIMHDDTATGLPLTPNGSDIQITWNAEGIIQAT